MLRKRVFLVGLVADWCLADTLRGKVQKHVREPCLKRYGHYAISL